MNENVLVTITVSRKKDEIVYKVDCAKEVKSEELAHYLDEIIEGICTLETRGLRRNSTNYRWSY